MGRPKKPDALKALEGDRGKGRRPGPPGDRPLGVGGLVCPDYLSGYAVEVWHQVTQSMPPQLYAACDSQHLVAFCNAAKLQRQAAIELDAATDLNDISKWATLLCKSAATIVSAGAKLGLDPSSRSAMVMPSTQKEQSKFAGLIQIAGGRNG